MFTIINSRTINKVVLVINSKQQNIAEMSYPSEEEIKAAQLACCGRFCKECETPAAYAWRKRDVDLAILLERAINRELSETERETIIDRWFNSLTQTQISRKRGISSAAVKNTLDRAQEKLERVLSYVVCYQQNVADESIIPLALGRARVIAAARNTSGGTSGDRLLRLRQSQSINKNSLSAATGISVSRIERLENGDLPKTDELLTLSEFFDVKVDFILKGERDGR